MNKKNLTQIFLAVAICALSIAAIANGSTTIGNNIATDGTLSAGTSTIAGFMNIRGYARIDNNSSAAANEISLTLDSTFKASSSALLRLMGTISRMYFISGEPSFPTTWAMGINTAVSDTPNQNFEIRQITNGSGNVDQSRLAIDKLTGYVGVGTTTPSYKLDLANGSIGGVNSLFFKESGGSSQAFFTFGQMNDLQLAGSVLYLAQGDTSLWTAGDVEIGNIDSEGANLNVYGDFGIWSTSTDPLATPSPTSSLPRLFVNSDNGNIGIGTTTPEEKLHLYSDQGIQLHIDGITPQVRFTNSSQDNNNKSWNLYSIEKTFRGVISTADFSGGDIAWLEVQRNNLNVDTVSFPNGNVGIGTTSPSQLFTVGNSINSQFLVDTLGNVTIDGMASLKGSANIEGFVNIGTTSVAVANLYVYDAGAGTSTVFIDTPSVTKGSCLKLKDSDGVGYTYCTFLNGVMSCSTTSCE